MKDAAIDAPLRARYIVTSAVLLVLLTAAGPAVSPATGQASVTALGQFEERLLEYLNLRRALAEKLKPLAPTANATELATRQAELAAALRAARATARAGDIIPPPVAEHIRALVVDDFRQRAVSNERALFSEIPRATRPDINRTYPADAALPTVPALLLMRLPRLPDNLQYRFYGRHFILLDGDVQIIVDYIPNVLPPR